MVWITVADYPDAQEDQERAWDALRDYLVKQPTDVLVLPEMPFSDWCYEAAHPDVEVWQRAVDEHEQMIARLPELGVQMVATSRPIRVGAKRFSQALLWSRDTGSHAAHNKFYLPDETDHHEARWFDQGDRWFVPVKTDLMRIGFELGAEMLFLEHARELGQLGAQLIAQPRACDGHRHWLMASALSGVVSGAFVATANRSCNYRRPFSGGSYVFSPDGDVLVFTTPDRAFASVRIDLTEVKRAKSVFPRTLCLR